MHGTFTYAFTFDIFCDNVFHILNIYKEQQMLSMMFDSYITMFHKIFLYIKINSNDIGSVDHFYDFWPQKLPDSEYF